MYKSKEQILEHLKQEENIKYIEFIEKETDPNFFAKDFFEEINRFTQKGIEVTYKKHTEP